MRPPRRYKRITGKPPSNHRMQHWFVIRQDGGLPLDGGASRNLLAEEVLEWVEANVSGAWSYATSTDIFKFAEDNDAFAFQMRWC